MHKGRFELTEDQLAEVVGGQQTPSQQSQDKPSCEGYSEYCAMFFGTRHTENISNQDVIQLGNTYCATHKGQYQQCNNDCPVYEAWMNAQ